MRSFVVSLENCTFQRLLNPNSPICSALHAKCASFWPDPCLSSSSWRLLRLLIYQVDTINTLCTCCDLVTGTSSVADQEAEKEKLVRGLCSQNQNQTSRIFGPKGSFTNSLLTICVSFYQEKTRIFVFTGEGALLSGRSGCDAMSWRRVLKAKIAKVKAVTD